MLRQAFFIMALSLASVQAEPVRSKSKKKNKKNQETAGYLWGAAGLGLGVGVVGVGLYALIQYLRQTPKTHEQNSSPIPPKPGRVLLPLRPEDSNLRYAVDKNKLTIPTGIKHHATSQSLLGVYHSYNSESVDDHMWGCAWRAMQTSMSSFFTSKHEAVPSLRHMFENLATREELLKIYADLRGIRFEEIPDSVAQTKFAPNGDLSSGWAEPFIGQLMMHHYGIKTDLFTVNDLPAHRREGGSRSAPDEAFDMSKNVNFKRFHQRLIDHFKAPNAAAVMLDDSYIALNIIGVGSVGNRILLWFADPHIERGANKDPHNQRPYGMYTAEFDQDGNQLTNPSWQGKLLFPNQMSQSPQGSTLSFSKKPWMVLIPIEVK